MGKRSSSRPEQKRTKDLMASWLEERPDLDLQQFLLSIAIQRSGRILESAFDRLCRENYDISGQDMRVLFALRRNGAGNGLRPTDLFRALLVTSGAITKQVDRLQAKGLVARVADGADGNFFKVFLTKAGLTVANSATEMQATSSLLAEVLGAFDEDDISSGANFVHRILESLEQKMREESASQRLRLT